MNTLTENLAHVLPEIGSDREIAEQFGVAQSTVWRWRFGHIVPSETYVQRIANASGVSPSDLRYTALTSLETSTAKR